MSAYTFRPYQPGDCDAVAALAVQVSSSPETACGQPDVSSADEFAADYGHRHLEDEAWVAIAPDGQLVGFVAGSVRAGRLTLDGPIVDAAHTGQGIGTRLYQFVEGMGRHVGAKDLQAGVRSVNERGRRFLDAQGYGSARRVYVYETHEPLTAGYTLSEGYTIGELKPRYLLPFLMVMHECFPDYRLPSYPQRLFEPDKMKIFLALDPEDKPVGGVTAFYYPEDRMAYIYNLGVSVPHRRHGLSRGLLLSACEWLWETHQPRFVGLSTTDEMGIRRSLFEPVGFKLRYAVDYLLKPITERVSVS